MDRTVMPVQKSQRKFSLLIAHHILQDIARAICGEYVDLERIRTQMHCIPDLELPRRMPEIL